MDWKKTAKSWMEFDGLDAELQNELKELTNDDRQLEEVFYKNLEFGTGGMRGEIGVVPIA
jgi:phosphoglucomutase